MPRKRSYNPNIPKFIDQDKLPNYCYWESKGKGHWYTIYTENGKQKRVKIAGPKAPLSELHKAIERRSQTDYNSVAWLFKKFQKSPQYTTNIGDSTRAAWDYAYSIIENHPTKKKGMNLHQIPLDGWNPIMFQRLVDSVAEKHGPSSAYRVKEFIRRIFNWGSGRGYSPANPVGKPEMPKLRERQRLPDMEVVRRVEAFARARGNQKQVKGSCPLYIWPLMVMLRKCRLRGIEGREMTEAHLLEVGIHCERKKGSRANITQRDALLEEALDFALAYRNQVWEKKGRPIPIKPDSRPVFVGKNGQVVSRGAWQTAWCNFIKMAIREGVISEEERFSAHDLKRRGVTDTEGNRADKMEASGHKSGTGIEPYDKSMPVVKPSPG